MTSVWKNYDNGHYFSDGPEGMQLNGFATDKWPEWANGEPFAVFGPLMPWQGGACPVDPNILVRCIFRGRRPYVGKAIHPEFPRGKEAAIWAQAPLPGMDEDGTDIVAYEVQVAA
jgi:hypothetical protein